MRTIIRRTKRYWRRNIWRIRRREDELEEE